MTIINIHTIQNVPASLLNRDDNNSAKALTYGNVRRDRVSSQSLKRAMRVGMRQQAIDGGVWANRTTRIPAQVIEHLVTTHGHNHDAADQVVGEVFRAVGLKRSDKGGTAASIFAPQDAPEHIATAINTHFDDIAEGNAPTTELKSAVINALDTNTAIDLALFGRMLAELPNGRIDGAVGVSHAFGVTPSTVEVDFFTAVDDCAADGEAASTNLGVVDLTSPTFYRHTYLDTRQLAHNLTDNPQLTAPATQAYITQAVTALPSAKARSTAAHTLPDLVIATAAPLALSAANAFATPIVSNTVTQDAMTAMWAQIQQASKVTDMDIMALPLTPEAEQFCTDLHIPTAESLTALADWANQQAGN